MSNYTKATNFTAKDSLTTGDPGKLIKGSEIDAEYTAIATAITSKADTASPTFTGTPSAPTAASGTNTAQIATTAFVQAALSTIYPVGFILSTVTNYADSAAVVAAFGGTTWVRFGAGKVPVGYDSGDSDFNTVENTGGSKDAIVVSHSHTASTTSTDSGHSHSVNTYSRLEGGTGGNSFWVDVAGTTTGSASANITSSTTVNSAGSSGTNANLQPYVVVYMWKRTA
jgi:hypothetical protein